MGSWKGWSVNYDVILTGPITKSPDYRVKFALATNRSRLRWPGKRIWNPALLKGGMEWRWYMRQCLEVILGAPEKAVLVMLEGWRESPGALAEWNLARGLGLSVVEDEEENAPDQARVLPSPEAGCSPSPWRRMTPEEYARDFASFPPHRAEVTMAVKGVPASAEVSVFILSANTTWRACKHHFSPTCHPAQVGPDWKYGCLHPDWPQNRDGDFCPIVYCNGDPKKCELPNGEHETARPPSAC